MGFDASDGCLRPERFGPQIADATLCACVSPSPAEAIVEHRERVAGLELEQGFRLVGGARAKTRRPGDDPLERLGIMGSDDGMGQRDVG